MKTCKDCIAQGEKKDGTKCCKITPYYGRDYDSQCLVGKLISAIHKQRDRAIKAEKQFNDAAGFLMVHGWFGPMEPLTSKNIGDDIVVYNTGVSDNSVSFETIYTLEITNKEVKK